ncbi:hypothetical protein GCM10017673_41090 [Streptosporangium violaceochromogenes]|nr:hypothetical protein GCM10017673_41090 [Streptosporangium violaceochromogenes]
MSSGGLVNPGHPSWLEWVRSLGTAPRERKTFGGDDIVVRRRRDKVNGIVNTPVGPHSGRPLPCWRSSVRAGLSPGDQSGPPARRSFFGPPRESCDSGRSHDASMTKAAGADRTVTNAGA